MEFQSIFSPDGLNAVTVRARFVFIVPFDLAIVNAAELDGAAISLVPGTELELAVAAFFRANNISYEPVPADNFEEAKQLFLPGRADVLPVPVEDLQTATYGVEYMVLPEIIDTQGEVVGQVDEDDFGTDDGDAPEQPDDSSDRPVEEGTSGRDVLDLTYGPDVFSALSGRDVINGLGGNDEIEGNGGNDRLRGGSGEDTLLGGGGRDQLDGGRGNDVLSGGNGKDKLVGAGGNDDLQGGARADRLNGGGGNDTLNGGKGADVLKGGRGADEFVFVLGGSPQHDEILDFDWSLDRLSLIGSFDDFEVSQEGDVVQVAFDTGDKLSFFGFEELGAADITRMIQQLWYIQ